MNSPDRVERLTIAMSQLIQTRRLVDANQQQRDQWMLDSDARMREIDERIRQNQARIAENQAQIDGIIAVLTEMQADIVRLDEPSPE